MSTAEEKIRDYVEGVLASFDGDPADNDFQHGYQAAFEEVRRFLMHQGEAS